MLLYYINFWAIKETLRERYNEVNSANTDIYGSINVYIKI